MAIQKVNKIRISTSFSWLAVMGDILIFIMSSGAVGLSMLNRDIGVGIVFMFIALVSLMVLIFYTFRVALVARVDGVVVFRKFFTLECGRIERIVALRKIPFMKYPRYSLLFLDEKGRQQSIVLIPAFNYKEMNALRAAMGEG